MSHERLDTHLHHTDGRHAPHQEEHFEDSESVRDIVIGMSDGLTVPFALAAGLSGAVDSSSIIMTAGLAEVAAGAIAMGLGGYLAARTDLEHYASERLREEREVEQIPEREAQEVEEVLRTYGLSEEDAHKVTTSIRADKKRWVDFMMRFELGLEEPDPRRATRSALTIAGAYVAGGLVPLSPYALVSSVPTALVGGGDARRPPRLRLREGAVHDRSSVAERLADGVRRRSGGLGRVPHRHGDRLTCFPTAADPIGRWA
jgi:VIT1/CCC1 family predicted Fe2+/Mn2+ transporter